MDMDFDQELRLIKITLIMKVLNFSTKPKNIFQILIFGLFRVVSEKLIELNNSFIIEFGNLS